MRLVCTLDQVVEAEVGMNTLVEGTALAEVLDLVGLREDKGLDNSRGKSADSSSRLTIRQLVLEVSIKRRHCKDHGY